MDREAAEALFHGNVRLAYDCVRRYNVDAETRRDLQQAALVALWRAALKFDPDRGNCFSTYAVPQIRAALQECMRLGEGVYIPRRHYTRGARCPVAREADIGMSVEDLRSDSGDPTAASVDRLYTEQLQQHVRRTIASVASTGLQSRVLEALLIGGLDRAAAARVAGCSWPAADHALRTFLPRIRARTAAWLLGTPPANRGDL
jgi:RNA polymerase sigma factor (sigma-70 family)